MLIARDLGERARRAAARRADQPSRPRQDRAARALAQRRNTRSMPVIIASHDRGFLDATTNRTLFLRPGVSHYFALPFTRARAALAEADEAAARQQRDRPQGRGAAAPAGGQAHQYRHQFGQRPADAQGASYLKERAAKIEAGGAGAAQGAGGRDPARQCRHARQGAASPSRISRSARPTGGRCSRSRSCICSRATGSVLLGRNGAGKSQFMKLLTRAIGGEEVAGVRVAGVAEARSDRPGDVAAAGSAERRSTSSPSSARATSAPSRCWRRRVSRSRSRTGRSRR